MEFLRKKRRLAALGAVAALAGVTLVIVLPAFAASGSAFAGAPTNLSTPRFLLSGGENDCALFKTQAASVGTDQYFANNPKAISGVKQTLTATSNGATVYITATVLDKSNTHLSFSIIGGVVTDVGIKGGNGTDWYSYESQPGGGVTGDTGLTAPATTTPGVAPFYSLSQTVFCYTPKITCQADVPLSDPQHPGATIELPSCAGKGNVFFDFNSGTSGGKNYVSVYSYGGSGTPNTPLVGHVTGTLSGSPPTQTTLQYSDFNLPGPGPLHDMRYCKLDPRDPGNADPLRLATAYQSGSSPLFPNPVLQSPSADDPESTSCLISERTWVDSGGVVHFEAYFYSVIDGYEAF